MRYLDRDRTQDLEEREDEAPAEPARGWPGKRLLTMAVGRKSKAAPGSLPAGRHTLTMNLLTRATASPGAIQRKSHGAPARSAEVPGTMVERTGGGQPLPEAVRRKMERMFGADFSAVRVHEGPEAQALGALAYTRGTDIYFAPGTYAPETRRGQELLGHELAHVVQQARGRVQPTAQIGGVDINESRALESEADELGAQAAADPAHEPAAQAQALRAPDGRETLASLEAELGPGQPLDGITARRMAEALGIDISAARIHTGPVAARKAAAADALAFAVGEHVVMGAAAPARGTIEGDALLAHELAHLAQQASAASDPSARRRPVDTESSAAEDDADAAAAHAVRALHGQPAHEDRGARPTVKSGLSLQRCPDRRPTQQQARVPRTETTPYGTYQVVADSTPAPRAANTLTQAEFVRLQQAWTRVNDNSGGLIINGSGADKTDLIGRFGREMGRSQTFRELLIEITEDRAHPVTIEVGRDNASWLDAFATNAVDLADLDWLDDVPPPGVPFTFTQGEDMVHWLAERRYAATHGGGFGPAHAHPMQAGGLQERYRGETGQRSRTISQVRVDQAGGLHQGIYTDAAGNRIVISRDDSGGDPVPYKMEYFAAGNPTSLLTRVNNMVVNVRATGTATAQLSARFTTPSHSVTTPAQAVGSTGQDFVSPLQGVVPTGAHITVQLLQAAASGPATASGNMTWPHPFRVTTATLSVGSASYHVSVQTRRT